MTWIGKDLTDGLLVRYSNTSAISIKYREVDGIDVIW